MEFKLKLFTYIKCENPGFTTPVITYYNVKMTRAKLHAMAAGNMFRR